MLSSSDDTGNAQAPQRKPPIGTGFKTMSYYTGKAPFVNGKRMAFLRKIFNKGT